DDGNARILAEIGRWFRTVRESYYEARPASHLIKNDECLLTRKENSLYAHFPKPLMSSGVVLNPLTCQPRRATLLNTGAEVRATVETVPSWCRSEPYLRISRIPINQLSTEVPVIRLDFDDLDQALANAGGQDGNEYIF
ncbi:MAG: hypothetical protein HON70_06715, partial [Lentisphaerae bacterium]|nr:hypothetical protein [Lentisphaerota bacterium]